MLVYNCSLWVLNRSWCDVVWLLQDGNSIHGYKVFVYMILADCVLSLIGGFIFLFLVLSSIQECAFPT